MSLVISLASLGTRCLRTCSTVDDIHPFSKEYTIFPRLWALKAMQDFYHQQYDFKRISKNPDNSKQRTSPPLKMAVAKLRGARGTKPHLPSSYLHLPKPTLLQVLIRITLVYLV